MRESPTRSNPDAEQARRETPMEIVTEAQAETPSQAKATKQSSDLGPSARRPSPPATQAEKGKARVVDSDEEPLADQQDKLYDREIAELKAQLKRPKRRELEALRAELRKRESIEQLRE